MADLKKPQGLRRLMSNRKYSTDFVEASHTSSPAVAASRRSRQAPQLSKAAKKWAVFVKQVTNLSTSSPKSFTITTESVLA
jgi:hypothetical protein